MCFSLCLNICWVVSREYCLVKCYWQDWSLWNICDLNDHGYIPLVVNTSRSFPHSWLITGFLTRLILRVPLLELHTLPKQLNSPPVFCGVRVNQSLVLCVCFVDRCLFFWFFFLLTIVLFVLLRLSDSDYSFGIFKLFFYNIQHKCFQVLCTVSFKHKYI